mgnify:FL=1
MTHSGKSDGGETCAKCFELKMRIPIDYAFAVKMLTDADLDQVNGRGHREDAAGGESR